MSAHPSEPTSFLGLPPEVRHGIYLHYFRSITICSGERSEQPLALLRACRQVYHDAAALVIPNVTVYCDSSAAMIECFVKLGPERITQLRHMIVMHHPMAFQLDPGAESSREKAADDDNRRGRSDEEEGDASDLDGESIASTHADSADGYFKREHAQLEADRAAAPDSDSDDSDASVSGSVCYFHVGSLLGLFPGLQLDLLQLDWDVEPGSCFNNQQTVGCFRTLLEADGYRRLWMQELDGDCDPWGCNPSDECWKEIFERRFKPHGGKVEIKVPGWEIGDKIPWDGARDAGFTLVKVLYDTVDEYIDNYESDEDGNDGDQYGFGCEDKVGVLMYRGETADIAVKADDDRELRCVEVGSPDRFPSASDNLRKLFRENSWEAIKGMDGYDDCCHDDCAFGRGNQAFGHWF